MLLSSARTVIAIAIGLTALAAASRPARAQIVNVQGQLAAAPDDDGVTGQVELKLDWREGNAPLFDVGGSAAVMVRRGRLLALALAKGEYGESRDVELVRKTFEHLRARYTIDCRWRWEAFVQHEFDEFRRLSVRALAGTGPALQIVAGSPYALLAGAAYMFEIEQLDDRPDTIDAGDRAVAHRASLYLTGVAALASNVSVVQTVYVQPRLDDPGDLRLLGELAVTTKLTKHLALTDGLTVAYDRTPPDGVEPLDTQLKVALVVKF